MKWALGEYVIDKGYDLNLRNKVDAFECETGTRKAVHVVFVTPSGVKRNAYRNNIQAVVTGDDLFS